MNKWSSAVYLFEKLQEWRAGTTILPRLIFASGRTGWELVGLREYAKHWVQLPANSDRMDETELYQAAMAGAVKMCDPGLWDSDFLMNEWPSKWQHMLLEVAKVWAPDYAPFQTITWNNNRSTGRREACAAFAKAEGMLRVEEWNVGCYVAELQAKARKPQSS